MVPQCDERKAVMERIAHASGLGEKAVCQHQKDTAWMLFLVLVSYEGNVELSKVSFFSRQKPSCDHIMEKNPSDCNS